MMINLLKLPKRMLWLCVKHCCKVLDSFHDHVLQKAKENSVHDSSHAKESGYIANGSVNGTCPALTNSNNLLTSTVGDKDVTKRISSSMPSDPHSVLSDLSSENVQHETDTEHKTNFNSEKTPLNVVKNSGKTIILCHYPACVRMKEGINSESDQPRLLVVDRKHSPLDVTDCGLPIVECHNSETDTVLSPQKLNPELKTVESNSEASKPNQSSSAIMTESVTRASKSYRKHRRTKSVHLHRGISEFNCISSQELRGPYNYTHRKGEITKDIKHDFSGMIAVWSPMEQLRPDAILTTLSKHDRYVVVRDHWSFPSKRTETAFWRGIVAEFLDKKTALEAARELTMAYRNVITIEIDYLLNLFVDAELHHPMCGIGSCVISISGSQSSFKESRSLFDIETQLSALGNVTSLTFSEDKRNQGVLCKVSFSHVSQAYAAKLFFDGLVYRPISKFTVQVVETIREREILKSVKRSLIEFLDEWNFFQN